MCLSAGCDCDRVGSATLQCDRRTGSCECIAGVGGHKCDRCARGTTGRMPHCVPCGECFDDWDTIITELSSKSLSSSEFLQSWKLLSWKNTLYIAMQWSDHRVLLSLQFCKKKKITASFQNLDFSSTINFF